MLLLCLRSHSHTEFIEGVTLQYPWKTIEEHIHMLQAYSSCTVVDVQLYCSGTSRSRFSVCTTYYAAPRDPREIAIFPER